MDHIFCKSCNTRILNEWRKDKRIIKAKPLLFCSRSCSNKRVFTEETKKQISDKLRSRKQIIMIDRKCVDCDIIIKVDSRTPTTKGRCVICRETDKRKKEATRFLNSYIDTECLNCKKHIRRSGIGKYRSFCDQKCTGAYKRNETQVIRKELFEQGKLKYRRQIRSILFERFGHVCQICKHTEWNGQKIPLQVDHKDGCSANNSSSNLRLICHNCDAQLPTFAGKNRGKGRKAIGLKSYE
jgi:hypothetical protein